MCVAVTFDFDGVGICRCIFRRVRWLSFVARGSFTTSLGRPRSFAKYVDNVKITLNKYLKLDAFLGELAMDNMTTCVRVRTHVLHVLYKWETRVSLSVKQTRPFYSDAVAGAAYPIPNQRVRNSSYKHPKSTGYLLLTGRDESSHTLDQSLQHQ